MWFKLTYSIHSMYVRRSDQLPVEISTSDKDEKIIIWNRELDGHPSHLCCDVISFQDIDSKLSKMFDQYENNILPLESPPQIALPHDLSFDAAIDQDGNIPKKWGVPISIFPKAFRELQSSIYAKSVDDLTTFIKTMRWIQGATGTQNPFAFVSFVWSRNCIEWKSMPSSASAIALDVRAIDASHDFVESIRNFWKAGIREPLAHELIREAIDISLTNPRSSLLVGFSALETGVKDYVHYLVPNSDVILERLPSPPVMTMLNEVIPALHRKTAKNNQSFPLSKEDKEFLMKWVTQRNQVAHGVKGNVDPNKLRDLLLFVRRTLYMIDFYKGHIWAEKNFKDRLSLDRFIKAS